MCVGDCEERVDLGLAAKFGGDLEICIPYVAITCDVCESKMC